MNICSSCCEKTIGNLWKLEEWRNGRALRGLPATFTHTQRNIKLTKVMKSFISSSSLSNGETCQKMGLFPKQWTPPTYPTDLGIPKWKTVKNMNEQIIGLDSKLEWSNMPYKHLIVFYNNKQIMDAFPYCSNRQKSTTSMENGIKLDPYQGLNRLMFVSAKILLENILCSVSF